MFDPRLKSNNLILTGKLFLTLISAVDILQFTFSGFICIFFHMYIVNGTLGRIQIKHEQEGLFI